MSDEAIAWTRNVRAANPDEPWFNYLGTAGARAPHQVGKAWRDKHKGKLDRGWDRRRELTHVKQLEVGVIPTGTKLTPRPKEIPAWDDQKPDAKAVYGRLMENYAAFLAFTDAEVGRPLDGLRSPSRRWWPASRRSPFRAC
jgi:arylsulfatase